MKNDNCKQCQKVLKNPFMGKPARHLTSPNNSFAKPWPFCNKKCLGDYNKEAYPFWAELDRNASDSTCFVHDHWETDDLYRKIRVGKCRITNQDVRVEPLQPGDNSGQPRECYEHFELRK